MKEYGWTIEDFAKPAVKNSANGALNPLAQHRRPLTIEQVVQSRVVVDPLTLYMCSSISHAPRRRSSALSMRRKSSRARSRSESQAARCAPGSIGCRTMNAAILRRPRRKRHMRKPVSGPRISGQSSCTMPWRPPKSTLNERLGLCGPGEGPKLIDDGVTTLKGRVPVNPSGGLCSRGHRWAPPVSCKSPSWSGKCAARPASGRSRSDRKSPWRRTRAGSCWARTWRSIAARS